MKKIIIATLLVFTNGTSSFAQEKYEFLNITYDAYREKIFTSINGNEFTIETPVASTSDKSSENVNPMLVQVAKYQDAGWEVISLNSIPLVFATYSGGTHYFHIAYLRKKKL